MHVCIGMLSLKIYMKWHASTECKARPDENVKHALTSLLGSYIFYIVAISWGNGKLCAL